MQTGIQKFIQSYRRENEQCRYYSGKRGSSFCLVQDEELQQAGSVDTVNIGLILKEAVDSIFDPTSGMTEEQKNKFLAELENKIRRGKKLTADEMQYLRINNPVEYAKMAKVQIQREALEKRLKSCKSKQEAQQVYTDAMSGISDDDFAKQETIAAYDDAYEEFRRSEEYKKLPEKEEKDLKEGEKECQY